MAGRTDAEARQLGQSRMVDGLVAAGDNALIARYKGAQIAVNPDPNP